MAYRLSFPDYLVGSYSSSCYTTFMVSSFTGTWLVDQWWLGASGGNFIGQTSQRYIQIDLP